MRNAHDAHPFDYFDPVFVLNLDRDTDRLARVTARLQRLGVAFERVAALGPRGDEPYDPNKPKTRRRRVGFPLTPHREPSQRPVSRPKKTGGNAVL